MSVPEGWDAEICKRCERANPVGFDLRPDVWEALTEGRWHVLCLSCVNELAAPLGIDWTLALVGDLHPVSAAMCEAAA